MALPVLHASGTVTVSGTAAAPQQITDCDTPGTYVLEINLNALGVGDEVALGQVTEGNFTLDVTTHTYASLEQVGVVPEPVGIRVGPLPVETPTGSEGFYIWNLAGTPASALGWQLWRYG